MKILYITFIDFGEKGSGSSVRPQKIYDAFIRQGHEVILLEGLQNRRAERRDRVRKIFSRIENDRPDICYIEPPSGPFFNSIDLKLIKKVHNMGIPQAIFYRDAHWLYAKWWRKKGLKTSFLRALHRRDLATFCRCCDIIYFPSASMAALFKSRPIKKTGVLPPACDTALQPKNEINRRLVYVGGVSQAYGVDLLLAAMRLLKPDSGISLDLICRENEMKNLPEETYTEPWLHIHHLQGDALKTVFEHCDAGIIPFKRDIYMDFAIPVKLFEYLGQGLPVISTDCTETAGFIRENQCGIVCNATPPALSEAIMKFYKNDENRGNLTAAVSETAQKNLWDDRVKKITTELSGFIR